MGKKKKTYDEEYEPAFPKPKSKPKGKKPVRGGKRDGY